MIWIHEIHYTPNSGSVESTHNCKYCENSGVHKNIGKLWYLVANVLYLDLKKGLLQYTYKTQRRISRT